MDFFGIVQAIVGGILFFATGYLASLAFFAPGKIDGVERAVYSLALSILVPALAVFVLNLVLGIPIFNTLGIYAVFLAVSGVSLFVVMQRGALPAFGRARKYNR